MNATFVSKEDPMNWLLFISQLPTHPSSLRVNVWRKMRTAGACGLQNGVWVLPDQPEHVKFLEELLSMIQSQGASGQLFRMTPFNEEVEKDILSRISTDREEEYAEFIERSQEFLAEIKKESAKQKFTFAELEENEQDLFRLSKWLERIQRRDFFCGDKAKSASETLELCQKEFDKFAAHVYARQTDDSANENPNT